MLLPELADSPPNDALVRSYRAAGLGVDLFAPGAGPIEHSYGPGVRSFSVEYGYRWLAANSLRFGWRRYFAFSGTAEDPLAIVGALASLHRRPSIALVDEIRSGSYRGDSRELWKRLCRRAIRRADVCIVNDASRVDLVRRYAHLQGASPVLIYPGGYVDPPAPVDRDTQRELWGAPPTSLVIGLSGGFNLTAGVDWLIDAVDSSHNIFVVVQPLGIGEMARYLLGNLRCSERIYVERRRLAWRQAWSQAGALDIGVAVYLNTAPQFQNMGTSSNRLCMYLAMGVPVIASRQESFRFLEDYDCGVLVEDGDQFSDAIRSVRARLPEMKVNAKRCWKEYVNTSKRYSELADAVAVLLK